MACEGVCVFERGTREEKEREKEEKKRRRGTRIQILTTRYGFRSNTRGEGKRDSGINSRGAVSQISQEMTAAGEEATAYKQKGNQAFAAHDWPTAIDFYSQAIALNDQDPSFYCNRAQVSAPGRCSRDLKRSD